LKKEYLLINYVFIDNGLAVCGEKFLGFFDSDVGEALRLVECASELTDICFSDRVVFCAGYRGCFALVCRDSILVEKSLEVKGESTWSSTGFLLSEYASLDFSGKTGLLVYLSRKFKGEINIARRRIIVK